MITKSELEYLKKNSDITNQINRAKDIGAEIVTDVLSFKNRADLLYLALLYAKQSRVVMRFS